MAVNLLVFIGVAGCGLAYLGSWWTPGGRRFAFCLRRSLYADWKLLPTPRYTIYYRRLQTGDHSDVKDIFFAVSKRAEVWKKMARIFRRGGNSEEDARKQLQRWLKAVRLASYYLIIPRAPRCVGGLAQLHWEAPLPPRLLGHIPLCVLGMERFILRRPALAENAAIHELVHVAQECRDELLTHEMSGVCGKWRCCKAEWEAHLAAPGAPARLLWWLPILVAGVGWYVWWYLKTR